MTSPRATPIPRSAWTVLAATGLGMFIVGLDLSIANVAFPDIQRSFPTASLADLSWVLNGYIVLYAGLLIVAGRLADQFGRRRLFLTGLVGFVAASVLVAAAPTKELLIGARALQGASAAFATPASFGLVVAAFPVERRSTAVALWGAILAVAVATGPSLGAAVIELSSWRWAFLLNIPIGLPVLLFASRVLTESARDRHAPRPDWLGGLLVTSTALLATLAIVQGGEWGWTSAAFVGVLGAAAASLVLLVRRMRHHRAPIVPAALFRERSFNAANAAMFIFSAGFFAMFLGGVLFLTRVWGYSALEAGLAITPGPAMVAIVAGPAGRLADRFGHRAVVTPALLIYAAGMVWRVLALDGSPNLLGDWLPSMLLLGIGVGGTFPILGAAAVTATPASMFAVAGAVTQTARQLGGALGIAVLIALLGTPTPDGAVAPFDRVWAFGVASATVAAAVALLLPGPAREPQDDRGSELRPDETPRLRMARAPE